MARPRSDSGFTTFLIRMNTDTREDLDTVAFLLGTSATKLVEGLIESLLNKHRERVEQIKKLRYQGGKEKG